jgi:NDP-sugar pyrophosphorylase family protein
MDAMILAAGLGTRLAAIGVTIPKLFIEVGGRPLLDRHLEYLQAGGVRRVVINVHHQGPLIEAAVRAYDGPLDVVCVHEERLLGTAGGVRNALSEFAPGPIIVLYGDVVVDDPVEGMVKLHRDSEAAATLAVHRAGSAEGKGVVDIDDSGRVMGFREKLGDAAGQVWVNSGIYVIESEVIASLERGAFCDFGHDVFPQMITNGSRIMAFRLRSAVVDVGTRQGLSLAHAKVPITPAPPPVER